MVLMDIHGVFEQRKKKMQNMLRSNNGSMALKKKQEIQGALSEIDIFLSTLRYYHDLSKNAPEPKLVCEEIIERENSNRFSRFFKKK